MNLRFIPTSYQTINNTANDTTGFLWFHSVECDVGIVIKKEDIEKLKASLDEIKTKIETKEQFFGKIYPTK